MAWLPLERLLQWVLVSVAVSVTVPQLRVMWFIQKMLSPLELIQFQLFPEFSVVKLISRRTNDDALKRNFHSNPRQCNWKGLDFPEEPGNSSCPGELYTERQLLAYSWAMKCGENQRTFREILKLPWMEETTYCAGQEWNAKRAFILYNFFYSFIFNLNYLQFIYNIFLNFFFTF